MIALLLALCLAAPRVAVEPSTSSRGRYVVARDERVRGLALPSHHAHGFSQRARLLPDGSTEITVVSAPEPENGIAQTRPPVDPAAEPAALRSLAEEIAGDVSDDWSITERTVTWVSLNIAHDDGLRAPVSPMDVVAGRRASCVGRSELACSLLRASGVPARTIHGLLVTGSRRPFILHRWIESWVDGLGWVPSDPGDSVLCVDARHVFASTDAQPYRPEAQGTLRLRTMERPRPLGTTPGAKALVKARRPPLATGP